MPASIFELQQSRRTTHGESSERLYLVMGTDSEATAVAQVNAAAPASFTAEGWTYYRGAPEVSPVVVDTSHSTGMWECRVPYKTVVYSSPQPQEYDSTYSFDTTGGTQHLTQSIATIHKYGTNPTDHKGAIGFDGENVQGVDITVPVYKFAETHQLPASKVTDLWKQEVEGLTGKVNNATFKGYAAGEVLFLGASGTRRGRNTSDLWEVSFYFAVSRNKTGLTVGDITSIAKSGWDYLWVEYENTIDATSKSRRKTPKAAYVEMVYYTASFANLIPTRS